MENILQEINYEKLMKGISMFSSDIVTIIGERKVKLEDGRIVEQYLYNIDGYTPKNGKPFVSLKANIIIEETKKISWNEYLDFLKEHATTKEELESIERLRKEQ